MKILLTGVAGFIGMHVAIKLLADGHDVLGIDNMNDYYDVGLKEARLKNIGGSDKFQFFKIDICHFDDLYRLFSRSNPTVVINMAAQAGVRYSIKNPMACINSNIIGFQNILECCKEFDVQNLIYASSSSVYGLNEKMPFSEKQNVDHPLSVYGASKKSNELMAHAYSNLYNLPTTGLRFFTVYGPWGRPDMALFKFAELMQKGEGIDVYNHGKMERDFTYIDDVVESIVRLISKPASIDDEFDTKSPNSSTSNRPWRIFNVGNGRPGSLLDYITALEVEMGETAKKNFMELQPGDVLSTFSDGELLQKWVNYSPRTKVEDGVQKFVKWYKNFYLT